MAPYDIIKQGYLLLLTTKKGTFQRKKWAKHWFLFIEDMTQLAFIYFKSEEQYIARDKNNGFIRFDDCLSFSVIGHPGSTQKNAMVVNTPKKRYIIAAESRYELHEWVYQLHTSLDEFKRKQNGVYSTIPNISNPASVSVKGKPQEVRHSGIYSIVQKAAKIKPTRQAPPVPPRSKEMTLLHDDTSAEGSVDENCVQSHATLASFGSGSDADISHALSGSGRHKRSLSDSLIISKVNLEEDTTEANNDKAFPALKKTTSDTDLFGTRLAALVDASSFFQQPVIAKKKLQKRRKTIALTTRTTSPPIEPPPPPPVDGETSQPTEVNQAIIEALYALDEELRQNTALSPTRSLSKVAPANPDHTTAFDTFQSPPPFMTSPSSSSTAAEHLFSPDGSSSVDVASLSSQQAHDNVAYVVVPQLNGHTDGGSPATDDDSLEKNTLLYRSPDASGQREATHCTVEGHTAVLESQLSDDQKDSAEASGFSTDVCSRDIPKSKKIPPPVKPKPAKPIPPRRTTSYNQAIVDKVAELSKASRQSATGASIKSASRAKPLVTVTVSSTATGSQTTSAVNRKPSEPPAKEVPQQISFPTESERKMAGMVLTTFSLDDLNKDAVAKKGLPRAPKVQNLSGTSLAFAYKTSNFAQEKQPAHATTTVDNSTSPKSTGLHSVGKQAGLEETKRGQANNHNNVPLLPNTDTSTNRPKTISSIFQSMIGDLEASEDGPILPEPLPPSSSTNRSSGASESMSKMFQNWPRTSTPANSAPEKPLSSSSSSSKWKESEAHQHIYDDPWDQRKMASENLSLSQTSLKAGDRGSLERRRNSGGLISRRVGSTENLYKKNSSISSTSTENLSKSSGASALRKRGASSENLSKLDPTSPLYLYKKALKNHEQQQTQQQEKERSLTLPSKGERSSSIKMIGERNLSQQSLQLSSQNRFRSNTVTGTPVKLFNSMQNISGARKASVPQQHLQPQPQPQPPQQPQRKMPPSTSYQPPNGNYKFSAAQPNGRPASSATQPNARPASSAADYTFGVKRQNSNKANQPPQLQGFGVQSRMIGKRPDDWRYVKPGTHMTYDRDSDSTILRSLV